MKKFGALLLTALAGSCVAQTALVRQHNPTSEVEAGAVTISASAPMRWEDVVGELRPEFNSATARDYVNTAIATTQQDFSSRREATAVQLGVDVSGQTTQSSQTTETTAAGTTTTGRTVESQNAATPLRRADGGQIADGTIAAPNNAFAGADRPAQWPTDSASIDPILRYRAATALHQELVLLDNYLDSAYDPCLQEAWLVRTRLVATPYARNQPIDAYSRIYATYQVNEGSFQSDRIRIVPLLVTDNFERSDSRRYEQLVTQLQGSLNGVSGVVAAGLGFNRYLNNLNAILGSQYNNLLTISQIDDYTLMVRLGAALSPTSRYEMQSRSYDITFLVVIDREEIAKEAEYRPNGGPPRIALGFFAQTEMRHAETGEPLPVMNESQRRGLLGALGEHAPPEPVGASAWERIRHAAQSADSSLVAPEDAQALPDDVRVKLNNWLSAANADDEWSRRWSLSDALSYDIPDRLRRWILWSRVRHAVDSGIASEVSLEDVRSLVLPDDVGSELVRWFLAGYGSSAVMPVGSGRVGLPAAQNGVFRDSLASGLSAQVVGPPGLNSNHFRAELLVEGGGEPPLTFAANSVSVNPEGVISATFPSLGGIGINPDSRTVRLHLERQCPSGVADTAVAGGRDARQGYYTLRRNRAVLASAPVQAASFQSEAVGGVSSLTPAGPQRASGVRVRLRGIDDRNNPYVTGYQIQVRGAILDAATRFGDDGRRFTIEDDGSSVRVGREFSAYNLGLSSLTAGTPVQIRVVGIGIDGNAVPGEESIVGFTVVQPPANSGGNHD